MIDIKNLSLKFPFNGKTSKPSPFIFKDISAKIFPGTSLAIVGPNGSGKSSFLKIIAGHIGPSGGHIQFHGINQGEISYLPTDPHIEKNFPISVLDFILFAFHENSGLFNPLTSDQIQHLEKTIQRFEIGPFINQPLAKISTGQFRRILLARIYLENKKMVILDEPFNALDTSSSKRLIQVISEWRSQNKIVMTVLHNKEFVKKYFDTTLFISSRYVAFGPTNFVIGNAPSDLSIKDDLKDDLKFSTQYCLQGHQ